MKTADLGEKYVMKLTVDFHLLLKKARECMYMMKMVKSILIL
mgnify:CR=1 FL=1